MDNLITEKQFPIHGMWILKKSIPFIFILLILLPFVLVPDLQDKDIQVRLFIVVIYIPLNLLYIILRKKMFHFEAEEHYLTLRQGVFSKQQRHIPYGVIQNVLVKQDLFDRIFGLASLTIENASSGGGQLGTAGQQKIFGMNFSSDKRRESESIGFSGNKISIPGLSKQSAEMLKEIMLQKIRENPIEDSQSGL